LQASLYARAIDHIARSNITPEQKASLTQSLDSHGGADHRISKSQFQFAKDQLRIAKIEDHVRPPTQPFPTLEQQRNAIRAKLDADNLAAIQARLEIDTDTQPTRKLAQPSTNES
jgi:hypothetical protein